MLCRAIKVWMDLFSWFLGFVHKTAKPERPQVDILKRRTQFHRLQKTLLKASGFLIRMPSPLLASSVMEPRAMVMAVWQEGWIHLRETLLALK